MTDAGPDATPGTQPATAPNGDATGTSTTAPDASATTWTALDLARHIAQLAYDMQADQALILNVCEALQVTDYFVICEGRNKRHVNSIAQHVAAELKKTGLHRIGAGDLHNERWVLLDYGPVVFHVFSPDAREFYDLENLWGDCERVEWTPVDPGSETE